MSVLSVGFETLLLQVTPRAAYPLCSNPLHNWSPTTIREDYRWRTSSRVHNWAFCQAST